MKTKLLFTILFTGVFNFAFTQDSIQNKKQTDKIMLEGNKGYEFIYTNAVNFDFGNTAENSIGYFGHINYFFNVKKKDGTSRHYLNTGLMKANYYAPEINKGYFYQTDNVLESALSLTQPGSPYIKEYNKYDFDVKLSSYSAYVQYLFEIFKDFNSLFFHAHMEMLITNMETSVKITTLDTIRSTLPTNEIIPVTGHLEREASYSKQNIGAYFGVGATAKFRFGTQSPMKYFLQGTAGFSNTQLNPKLYQQSENELPVYEEKSGAAPFFIIHSYFENDISGVNLILGGQIRGNFTTAPLYMFYIGLNTDFTELKGLF